MFFFKNDYPKSHVSTLAAKSLVIVIVFFQWFTCFIFILSNSNAFIALNSLIFFGGFISLPVIWLKYNQVRDKLIKDKSEKLINEVYVHPLEAARNHFLGSSGSSIE